MFLPAASSAAKTHGALPPSPGTACGDRTGLTYWKHEQAKCKHEHCAAAAKGMTVLPIDATRPNARRDRGALALLVLTFFTASGAALGEPTVQPCVVARPCENTLSVSWNTQP